MNEDIFGAFQWGSLEETKEPKANTPVTEEVSEQSTQLTTSDGVTELTADDLVEQFGEQPEVEETHTKEDSTDTEITEDEDSLDVFETLINDLADEKGILYYDKDKEYSEGAEGLQEIIQDTVKKQFEDWKSGLGETALKFVEHVEAGGDPNTFIEVASQIDYKAIDVNIEENQQGLLEEYFEAQEYSADEIKDELTTLKDLGADKFKKKAEVAKRFLAKRQEEENQIRLQSEVKAREEQERKVEEIRNGLKKEVQSIKTIADFPITEKENKDLVTAIFEPSKRGDVKADEVKKIYYGLINAGVAPEVAVKHAYVHNRDFKFNDLKKEVKTTLTQKLEKKLANYQDKNLSSKGGEIIKNKDQDDNFKNMKSWF